MKKDARYLQPFLPPIEEYTRYLEKIWISGILTNDGKLVTELEKRLKAYLGAEHLILYSNGHLAIEATLQMLDIHGEVITTPLTFASTAHAIIRCGCTPVFCDIDEETLTIDVTKIEDLINEKTVAIMPVHVYGNVCNMKKIQEIADRYNLKVVYDAAHTFGVKMKGDELYRYGDASIISFHATKFFHTVEGGAVICKNTNLTKRLIANRNFGFLESENAMLAGGNAKMSEFHAAMGLCNLKYIENEKKRHREIAHIYQTQLGERSDLRVMYETPGTNSSYPYFYLIFNQGRDVRDKVCNTLKEYGYLARKYFYPSLTEMQSIRKYGACGDAPLAKRIAERIICLPIYSSLKDYQVYEICELIIKVIGSKTEGG